MAYTFPTLSVNPSVSPWEEGVAFDPTISSQAEGGYKQTRKRCTRIPDKWTVGYKPLPRADKILIRAFEKTVGVGSEIFQWINPDDNVTYNVRFAGPVDYGMHGMSSIWDVNFVLEEA